MTRTMFDAINVANLPPGALEAGYVGGHWTTFPQLRAKFPTARLVSIAVAKDEDAEVADVENGDITPEQSVDWTLRQRTKGGDPTVYCNASTWPAVVAAFNARGVPLPWWWEAHYDGVPKLSVDPRAIAKQYLNTPAYDVSVVADYWPGVDPPPALEADVFELIHNTATGDIFAWSAGGAWWHVPNPDWAKVALASPLCKGQRDVNQQEFDLLAAIASSARGQQ